MRVLVLRARAQAEATLRGLAERGHEGVSFPLLRIKRLRTEPPEVAPAGLIVTSANAVSAAVDQLARFEGLPVFAVGSSTARALAAVGFGSILSAEGDGRALAFAIAQALPAGSTLLHIAGRDRHPEPARTLTEAGFMVAIWKAYAAKPARRLPDALARDLLAGRIEAVLHYSRRSAETFTALARDAGLEAALRRLVHVCLSAEVAQGLAGVAAEKVIDATAPTEAALFDALNQSVLRVGGGSGSPVGPL